MHVRIYVGGEEVLPVPQGMCIRGHRTLVMQM